VRRLLLRIVFLTVAFLIVTWIVPGIQLADSRFSPVLAAAVFVLLNLLVTPLVWLLKIIAFPLNLLTLGIMSLLISFAFNILIFWVMGSRGWGIRVEGSTALILGPLLLGIISAFLNLLIPSRSDNGS
jgi:putative membrane protein